MKKDYEKECEECQDGIIIEKFNLEYPCKYCFDGKMTWVDHVLPPSIDKYEGMRLFHTNINIQYLMSLLRNECYKVGYTVDINMEPARFNVDWAIGKMLPPVNFGEK